MDYIRSVEQLVEKLDSTDPLEYAKVIKRVKMTKRDLAAYITWKKDGYTRNCLARNQIYELILLCWDVDAKAPIHGHGGKNCWVYQVQGSVEEIRFTQEEGNLKETNRQVLSEGKLTYMNDRMGYHMIGNISNERAMTLHLYASPIDACKVYNEQKDCFEIKEMRYHTFKGNEVESPV